MGENMATRSSRHQSGLRSGERLKVASWVFRVSCIPLAILVTAWIAAPFADAALVGCLRIRPGAAECQVSDLVQKSVKELATALLPIVSGWIGAVIAYYFVTDAHAQAAQDAQLLVGAHGFRSRLKRILLRQIMRLDTDIHGVLLPSDGDALLQNVEQVFKGAEARTRAVIFQPLLNGRKVVEVIHQSTYFEYKDRNREQNSIRALLNDPEVEKRLRGGTVWMPETATVEDALTRMQQHPAVQDIVVTKNGQQQEPILGYLTNGDVLRHCVASADRGEDESRD